MRSQFGNDPCGFRELAKVLAVALFVASVELACAEDDKKPFFRWMDNSVTLLPYGWHYKVDPSEQTTLTFEHVHDSAIGDLFAFMIALVLAAVIRESHPKSSRAAAVGTAQKAEPQAPRARVS